MKDKIKSLILYKGDDWELLSAELRSLVMDTDLKTLSLNTTETLLGIYAKILDVRNTIKHKDLSSLEDEALDELQQEYSDRFRINVRPTISEVYEASRKDMLRHCDELSLKVYFHSYLGDLLEPYIKISLSQFMADNNFNLYSYNHNLTELRPKLVKACSKIKVPTSVLEHLLELYDNFPDTFLGSLIPLMNKLENYKNATNKALYFEDY